MNPKHPETPTLLGVFGARADAQLERVLPPKPQPPQQLHTAMHYAVTGGGKRLRPVLVYATGSALGAAHDLLDSSACAVELIHAYSLVHDDLPAMDDDDLRRGRATCHVVFGEAMAILAGDALQALAFEVLAGDNRLQAHAPTHVAMLKVLAAACGSHGMAGGQALDLAAVGTVLTTAELERMHIHKTGALIRASVQLGALAAGCNDATTLAALDRYGHCIGLAFQIRDDILDVEGSSQTIGKTVGKDAAHAKPTFPAILGMDASRARLIQLTEAAIESVRPLGARMHDLIALARYVALREN